MDSIFTQREVSKEQGPLSKQTYNLLIGLCLTWGFTLNWAIVKTIPSSAITDIPLWIFLVGYFASCFGGIYLYKKYNEPAISFLGYNMIAVPFGLVVNVVVSRFDSNIVIDTIRLTAIITIVMMIMGSFWGQMFEKIIDIFTVILLILIISEFTEQVFFGIHRGVYDYIAIVIFCGYIGYDWYRANKIPRTIDNAIDSAAAIYMDIINLFLRLLRRRK